MSKKDISQEEALELIKMQKIKSYDKKYIYPSARGSISVALESEDKKETFFLDINRNGIALEKVTYQNRARTVIRLARLDFGAPHRNPDGKKVGSPHIHLYKEGAHDQWAYELPKEFTNPENFIQTLQDFMKYCSVKNDLYDIIDRDMLSEQHIC